MAHVLCCTPWADMREQDMRMTFDAADPHEIGKSGGDQVDRSRGAAKAITVSCVSNKYMITDHS